MDKQYRHLSVEERAVIMIEVSKGESLKRFWTFDGETPGMAPHLLVCADLLAIGDTRCIETAGEMRADIINRFK